MRRWVLAVAILAGVFAPATTRGACTNPRGGSGDQIYNGTVSMMQYCNGTAWVNMGSFANSTIGTLSPNDYCLADPTGVFVECTTAPTGTGSVVLSASPTLTGTVSGASANWTGTIGIATTTPESKLEIYGGEVQVGSSGAGCTPTNAGALRYASGTLYFCNGSTWTASTGGASGNVNSGTQYQMAYYASTGAAVSGDSNITTDASNNLLITAGKVGIGTTNPSGMAPGAGSGNLDITATSTSGVAYTAYTTSTTDVAVFEADADSSRFYLKSHSSGDTTTHFGTAMGRWAEILAVNNTGTNNGLVIGDIQNEPIVFGTNNLERMRITGAGYVGIGTASPSWTLHVRPAANENFAVTSNIGGATGSLTIGAANDANSALVPMEMRASSYDFSTGNVGIGTTVPLQALDVSGDTNIRNNTRLGTGWSRYLKIIGSNSPGAVTMQVSNTLGSDIADTAVPLVLQPSAGSVGIGTTATSFNLDIWGNSGTATLRLKNTGGGSQIAIDRSSTSSNSQFFFSTAGSEDFAFGTGLGGAGVSDFGIYDTSTSANAITIEKSNGNVGIGTTVPQGLLSLYGGSLFATSPSGFGGTFTANGQIAVGGGPTDGDQIAGQGSTYDVALENKSFSVALAIPTATTNVYMANNATIGNNLTVNGTSISLANSSGDVSIAANYNSGTRAVQLTSNQGGSTPAVIWTNSSGDTWELVDASVSGPGEIFFYDGTSNSYPMSLYSNGNVTIGGTLTQNSDIRMKKDVKPVENVFDKLALIKGVTFYWKGPEKEKTQQIGVIAQDVEKAFPQLVRKGDDGMLTVNYPGFAAPLIEAVKELKADNDNLRAGLKAANDNYAEEHAADRKAIDDLRGQIAELKRQTHAR